MTARDHNKLLGIFFLIHGGIQLFCGIFVALIYGGMGTMFLATGRQEERVMGGIFLVLAVVVGLLIGAFGGFYIFTGLKLRKEQSVARIMAIVASCLCLLGFPLGTALGVYGLWFLFGDLGKSLYLGHQNPMPYQSPQAPPPNSWQ
jgi:glucan phosphoethanolaminetransferase (alkaline phosphatase superfamily)